MHNKQSVTPPATTGASSEVHRYVLTRAGIVRQPVMAEIIADGLSNTTSAGITVKLETLKAGAWADACTAKNNTAKGTTLYLHVNALTKGIRYRLNVTAISNGVSVTAAYIGVGMVEN